MKKSKKIAIVFFMVILFVLSFVGCSKSVYTIEYETNGGTVEVDSREVEFDKPFILDVPQMDNATFLGWYDSPDANANAVTDEYGYSLSNYARNENMVVFARWDYWETPNLEYHLSLDNNSYGVSGGGEGFSRIRIPETYKGLPVTSINAYAFYDNSELIEVVCSNNVIGIGDFAFAKCNNLEKVSLSNNLTQIGKSSFADCVKLNTINVPSSLEKIDEMAFATCKSLAEMDFSSVNGELEIAEKAYQGCSVLATVNFGSAVKKLNKYTFATCTSLTYLDTGDYVEEIASYAFENSGVRTLKIGKNVKSIGTSFTNGCADLSLIEVHSDNQYYAAESSVLYNKNKTILLRYAPLLKETHYTVADNVETIATSSFDNVYYLERITIGNNIKTIEKGAFSRLNALETMDVPFIGGSVNFNNYFAYIFGADISSEVTNLPETLLYVNIAEGITTVPAYAFQYCGNLKEINIPTTVNSIGMAAFYGCSNLTEANIPKNVKSIGEFVFYACMRLKTITVSEENEYYLSDENVLYNKQKTRLLQYPAAKAEEEYTVADSVTTIEKGAFYNAVKLKTITLPQELKVIDDYAFSLCRKLEKIVLPDSVEYIGVQAFAKCRELIEINIPVSTEEIGQQCFDSCQSLTKVVIQGTVVPKTDSTVFLYVNEEMTIVFNSIDIMNLFKADEIWSTFEERFIVE